MTQQTDRQRRREKLRRRIMQCGLAGLTVFVLLIVMDAVTQTVLIAALGSSAFIAFAMPRSLHSGPRHLVGGYVVGMAAGIAMSLLERWIDVSNPAIDHAIVIVFGAAAISIAMFLMVLTRTEHPPAAALALGLVLNVWDAVTLLGILVCISALSLVKRLILPLLNDLV